MPLLENPGASFKITPPGLSGVEIGVCKGDDGRRVVPAGETLEDAFIVLLAVPELSRIRVNDKADLAKDLICDDLRLELGDFTPPGLLLSCTLARSCISLADPELLEAPPSSSVSSVRLRTSSALSQAPAGAALRIGADAGRPGTLLCTGRAVLCTAACPLPTGQALLRLQAPGRELEERPPAPEAEAGLEAAPGRYGENAYFPEGARDCDFSAPALRGRGIDAFFASNRSGMKNVGMTG